MPQSKSVIGVLATCLLGSCASVTGSQNQAITVMAICESSKVVKGAFCTLTNAKGQWFAESPSSVLVQKAFGDMEVSCKLGDSYGKLVLSSSSNANIWGNLLYGGPIGAAIDSGTGAGFNYPPTVTVNMSGSCK